jgi:DNA-binding NarL/FixJ family response regulator
MVALTSRPCRVAADATSVLIVTPNEHRLSALLSLLRQVGRRCLVAASESSARARLQHTRPALVLLDLDRAGGDGRTARARLQEFAGPATPVMVMTSTGANVASAGATAGEDHSDSLDTILKPVSAREVLVRIDARLRIAELEAQLATEQAARIAAEQRLAAATAQAGRVAAEDAITMIAFPESEANHHHRALRQLGLSHRETEVLYWMASGKTTREIATIIGAAVGTVRKHSEHIYAKLGVEGHRGAMLRALEVLPGR